MKTKALAITLALCMLLGLLAGCGDSGEGAGNYVGAENVTNDYDLITVPGSDYQYKKYKDMTEEKITLTYFHFDQDETVKLLADRFMKIYPNIEVKVQFEDVGTNGTTLGTLVTNGQAPDVIMITDEAYALSNMYLSDISAYFDSDEETKLLPETIRGTGVGTGLGTFHLEGGQRYAVPVKFFPCTFFVDRDVLETLNIKVPAQNWTWGEMIQLIKDATQPASLDGMAYYGLGTYNRLDSYYGIAAGQKYIGEFGFNGKTFDLSDWAIGEQEFSDLKLNGYVAPDRDTRANQLWTGDGSKWFGETGHVAVFGEAFWTFQNLWNTEYYLENFDMDIIPYVVPAVSEADAKADHHSIATIDWGGITPSCKYPREAYELLKFMSFGVDGWHTRCEIYADENNVNGSGMPLKAASMPVPITTDQGVWDKYINDVYCVGMDEEHTQHWKDFFASCMQPISFGWTSIAGYKTFCDDYFNAIGDGKGIHTLVDTGVAMAADYVDEATRKANYYHADAMLKYFGPGGYNVLSESEQTYYQQLKDSNT